LPAVECSPTHVGVADADALGGPIDVAPPQAGELGAAQAGHRRSADQHAKHRAEDVGWWGRGWSAATAATAAEGRRLAVDDLVGDRADDRLLLLERQEVQVGLDVAPAAALGRRGARR